MARMGAPDMVSAQFCIFQCVVDHLKRSRPTDLSALERGETEPGAAVLLAISREFGKSVDWLLTGKAHVEPKKRWVSGPRDHAFAITGMKVSLIYRASTRGGRKNRVALQLSAGSSAHYNSRCWRID